LFELYEKYADTTMTEKARVS